MIKKLILISTVLIVTSGCSEAYEKYVEGQDVYLQCISENDDAWKRPEWYSFNTDKEGESTGYKWFPKNPMDRIKLQSVLVEPTRIRAMEGNYHITLNRETLKMVYGVSWQCFSIGYEKAKNLREKQLIEITKNNQI